MAGSVTDKDNGYQALVKHLQGEDWSLTVGVHSAEGAQPDGSGPMTVAEIGTIQEFGNAHIPARSFVRAWADENEAANTDKLKAVAVAVFKGQYDAQTGLNRLGLLFVGGMQGRIASNIPPPNAPSTVAQKGSSTTLVNHGILRSSLRHKVTRGDGGT